MDTKRAFFKRLELSKKNGVIFFLVFTLFKPFSALAFNPEQVKQKANSLANQEEQITPLTSQSQFDALLGKWNFYQIHYRGELQPPLNPDLNLYFEFNRFNSESNFNPLLTESVSGESHLWWTRNNQSGICERRGIFFIRHNMIVDLITWVNPDNNMDCGSDPDMQLGRTTETKFDIQEDVFWLHLPLGAEDFSYLFRRVKRAD